jgi:DDE_Tnp_1-associated
LPGKTLTPAPAPSPGCPASAASAASAAEQRAAAAESALAVVAARAAGLRQAGASMLEVFAAVADPRDPRGVRHRLATILTLCAAAVLCGCKSVVEVTDWVANADQQVLAAAECRVDASGQRVPPCPDTFERVLGALDAQGLDNHLGVGVGARAGLGPVGAPVAGPALRPALAVDGKAMRGALDADGQIPYLLAAAT